MYIRRTIDKSWKVLFGCVASGDDGESNQRDFMSKLPGIARLRHHSRNVSRPRPQQSNVVKEVQTLSLNYSGKIVGLSSNNSGPFGGLQWE